MLSPINIILFVWYWNLTWVSITTIINYQITYFRSLTTSFLSLILGLIIMILMWISLDFCWILLCSSSDHLPEEVGTTLTVSMIAVVDLWFYIRTWYVTKSIFVLGTTSTAFHTWKVPDDGTHNVPRYKIVYYVPRALRLWYTSEVWINVRGGAEGV